MAANASIVQFVEDTNSVIPAIIDGAREVLSMLMEPPLVIFTAAALLYIGFRLGIRIYQSVKRA